MTDSLANKVVIITEPATCIGRAVKDVLLRHDCKIVQLSDDIQKEEKNGAPILTLSTKSNNYTSIVETCIQRFGTIHAVVVCSGELSRQSTESVTLESLRDMWKTQVTDPCQLIKAATQQLKINKGSVVFVSTASSRTRDDILSNLAVKERDWLSRLLAQEMSSNKISVNTVNSFGCETRSKSTWEWICSALYGAPIRGKGTARQVADHVALLLSSRMSHMTGSTMRIDGGLSLTCPGSYSTLMATLAYANNAIMGWWNRMLKTFHRD